MARPEKGSKSTAANYSSRLPPSDPALDGFRMHNGGRGNTAPDGGYDGFGSDPVDDPDDELKQSTVPRRRTRTMHASNWPVPGDVVSQRTIYSSNNEVTTRLQALRNYDSLLWANLVHPVAALRWNYPAPKAVQSENGVLVSVPQSRTYDVNAIVWEVIAGLSERSAILSHLRAKQWPLPPHIDMYSTNNTQRVARAPVGYNCFSYLAMLRILLKMVDDSPPSLEAKLTAHIAAFKVLEWYFSKLAMGRNEGTVKRYFFEAVQSDGDVIALLHRLRQLDAQHTAFDYRMLDEYRDDVIIGGYAQAEGCVPPKVLEALRKRSTRPQTPGTRGGGSTPRIRPSARGGGLKSGFSGAKGKPPAPILSRYFDSRKHKPPTNDGIFPKELCKKWQTDSCILTHGQKCTRFHLCQWCGLPHPGSRCRNNK